jgi:DNA polymerase I
MLVQVLDIDYIYTNKPIIRIFGKTENGSSICMFYEDFKPYFYAKTKDMDKTIEELRKIKDIDDIKVVEKFIPLGYREKPEQLLKITLSNPQNVPIVREQIASFTEEIFEADILFRYRFMVDHEIRGMQWIDADGEKVRTSAVKTNAFHARKIKPVERPENAELKYLSFDIECLPSDPNKIIDSKKDPIIIISLAFEPEYKGRKTTVLVAKQTKGSDIQCFDDEKQTLQAFLDIINDYDPDIITGYNINGFDLPYIFDRLKANSLLLNLGRCDKPMLIKEINASKEAYITGRVVVDPFQILKRDPYFKFPRYDLNTIAKMLLNEQKHEVEYGEMKDLWHGSHADLNRFIEYARKDAELALRLVLEKGMLNQFFALSRISGVLLQDAFGGQTKRVETMLLHEFRKRNFVMPLAPSKIELAKRNREREKKGIKGAVVLEPLKGLHTDGCILVLDFKSLYPSIMRTFNVSPDTLLTEKEHIEKYKNLESPIGAHFIDESISKGIFPSVLTRLIEERAKTKKQMKTTSAEEKNILNAKQIALKYMSNSFYGYTGYVRARLYVLDVANTITAFGRDNLEKTKNLVEKNFEYKVIYADTDSIFIKTNIENLDEAKEAGEKISKFVTENLPGVLELDFEKIYRTFLILTKKRYAGWRFEFTGEKWEDMIEMRGIETIRRDWCPLVSDIMNSVINIILKEGDTQKAIEEIKCVIEKLKKGEIPLEKLTIIKGITKGVDGYKGMLPHIELARKMTRRSPRDAPKIGDRIGFVIIKGNGLLSKRAEDPKYVREHGLQIDSDYYVNNQVFPPLERILNATGVEKSEIFGGGRQTGLVSWYAGKGVEKRQRKEITIKTNNTTLTGLEEFVCKKCGKNYKKMPLCGVCECGGELLFSFHGSVGKKISLS